MTTRLEAARAAVFATVRMYAPVHQNFSDEATRQLTKAIAEVESAAVDAAKPGLPAVPPLDTGPAPDLVKLNEPAAALPGAVGGMSADTVAAPTAPLNPPEVEQSAKAPKAGKSKGK